VATSGWDNFTQTDADRMNRARMGTRPHRRGPETARESTNDPTLMVRVPKPQKYRNTATPVDGRLFASVKEARRYVFLKSLADRRLIHNLKCQTRWEIFVSEAPGRARKHIAWWLSDFDYWLPAKPGEKPEHVVEDVKSPITRKNPIYRLKRKLVEALHPITISEV
jgi:hypothetical protein